MRKDLALFTICICVGATTGWVTRVEVGPISTKSPGTVASQEPQGLGLSESPKTRQLYVDTDEMASVRDPHSPDYDVMYLMSTTSASPITVFDEEPVDEEWAPVQEQNIRWHLLKDIQAMSPNVIVTDIECRKAMCKAAIASASMKELEDLTGPYPSAVMSDGTFIGGCRDGLDSEAHEKGLNRICFYLTYSEEHRDPDEYERWYKRHRVDLFEHIADGLWCQENSELCERLANEPHEQEDGNE